MFHFLVSSLEKYNYLFFVNFERTFGVKGINIFNIYTSYIKLHCMVFSKRFQFWVKHIPKKSDAFEVEG